MRISGPCCGGQEHQLWSSGEAGPSPSSGTLLTRLRCFPCLDLQTPQKHFLILLHPLYYPLWSYRFWLCCPTDFTPCLVCTLTTDPRISHLFFYMFHIQTSFIKAVWWIQEVISSTFWQELCTKRTWNLGVTIDDHSWVKCLFWGRSALFTVSRVIWSAFLRRDWFVRYLESSGSFLYATAAGHLKCYLGHSKVHTITLQ